MCLTICPTFDSIHSRMMKSFIIKKPNQTTPQFGNLWLGSPGREDQRGWLQTHTPLIYSFFHPGPNYSLRVKSDGSESLQGRASMSTEKGLNDAVTLLWYHLVTAARPQGFLVKQCTLVHKQGWRMSVLPVPPHQPGVKAWPTQAAGWQLRTAHSDLYFDTWQLSTWKNSPSDANISLQRPRAKVNKSFLTTSSSITISL